MIDRHYGHLANDSREHAVSLLDALAFERAVDAAWTSSTRRPGPLRHSNPCPHSRPARQRETERVKVNTEWYEAGKKQDR